MGRLRAMAVAGGLALALVARPAAAQEATLTLTRVFGSAASSLSASFGTIDAMCLSVPAPGITCVQGPGGASVTWYGTVEFEIRVKPKGGAAFTLRFVGARQATGSVPPGALLDGAAGVPTTPYPIAPASPLTLVVGIDRGKTRVARSLGLRVQPTDAAGAWSTPVAYSLIVE